MSFFVQYIVTFILSIYQALTNPTNLIFFQIKMCTIRWLLFYCSLSFSFCLYKLFFRLLPYLGNFLVCCYVSFHTPAVAVIIAVSIAIAILNSSTLPPNIKKNGIVHRFYGYSYVRLYFVYISTTNACFRWMFIKIQFYIGNCTVFNVFNIPLYTMITFIRKYIFYSAILLIQFTDSIRLLSFDVWLGTIFFPKISSVSSVLLRVFLCYSVDEKKKLECISVVATHNNLLDYGQKMRDFGIYFNAT